VIGGIATVSLLLLAVIYRPLVVGCFDPGFLRAVGGRGGLPFQEPATEPLNELPDVVDVLMRRRRPVPTAPRRY
jgi:hypothetical protein